jgi:hypothetical protein
MGAVNAVVTGIVCRNSLFGSRGGARPGEAETGAKGGSH